MAALWPADVPAQAVGATIDAGAANCGRLIELISTTLGTLEMGEILRVVAQDPSALVDIPAWCRMRAHRLVAQVELEGHFLFVIKKGA